MLLATQENGFCNAQSILRPFGPVRPRYHLLRGSPPVARGACAAQAAGGGAEPGQSDAEKKPLLGLSERRRYGRLAAERKWEVIDLVGCSPSSKARTLEGLGIPRSTYLRWQRRFRQQGKVGLVDRRPQPGTVW